jgi:hypothetical protein
MTARVRRGRIQLLQHHSPVISKPHCGQVVGGSLAARAPHCGHTRLSQHTGSPGVSCSGGVAVSSWVSFILFCGLPARRRGRVLLTRADRTDAVRASRFMLILALTAAIG